MTQNFNPNRNIIRRSYATQKEREIGIWRHENSWPHIRPASVLVCAMGNHWQQGTWQKTIDMVKFASDKGVYCAYTELLDRCSTPMDAFGTMRNEALIIAMTEGFEWLCYVDNDIQPEPDYLMKLLSWDVPIVAPFVVESGTGRPLHGPIQQPNTGLRAVKWTVLSLLVFRVSVFNCVGPRFWGDAIGADEGYHFQTLWHYGHRPYLDTNTQLVVSKRPTYPLSGNRMGFQERMVLWEEKRASLMQPPDRRPINPNENLVENGEYWPFKISDATKPAEPGTVKTLNNAIG